MKYRKLGGTSLKVSEIGFGCWPIGSSKGNMGYGKVKKKDSIAALEYAYERGINFFDTANLYGNGFSEKILGEVFKNKRHNIIISTKGGTLPHKTLFMPQNFTKHYLEKSLNKSLKRLNTDYIDLYQLHSPKISDILQNDTLETLASFKKSGKIRHIGISARTPEDCKYFLKLKDIDSIQINFNIIDQRIRENKIIELAIKKKVGIIARTPLAFGFLTDKVDLKKLDKKNDHRTLFPSRQIKIWQNSPNFFKHLFKKKYSSTEFCLRYCLDFKGITSVIPGMKEKKEVAENINATFKPSLSKNTLKEIANIYKKNKFFLKNLKGVKDKKNN